MIDTPKTSHYFFIRMEPSCPQPLETCHSPGIIPDIYSCGENCLDTLIKNLNGKPQMDKKNNQNWGQLPDYLWVETATSVCFHSNYVNLHPCMHSLWEAQMRGAEQNRETLQDRAVGWEAHLEIEAPQCSLQQSPSSPAEAVWGSIATAVPSLYKLLLSQKCQTCGVSVLPVTAQLYVPNKVLWQDEKANVREQGLLREKFCELVIEVIVSGKKSGRQLRRGTWIYTPVTVNRGWGQRKKPLGWQLSKTETVKGEGRQGAEGKYENQQTREEHTEKGKKGRQSRRSNLRLFGGEMFTPSVWKYKGREILPGGGKKGKKTHSKHNKLILGVSPPTFFFFKCFRFNY